MKVYLSADIEGVAGISAWEELDRSSPEFHQFSDLMTEEVVAACSGARAAGTGEVVVQDAHWLGRNLLLARLPDYVRIVRGWSGHPLYMLQDLDESFQAVMFVGYHGAAQTDVSPVGHTYGGRNVFSLTINGHAGSEFLINSWAAELMKVPVAFISGDEEICGIAKELNPDILAVPVSRGNGPSSSSLSPMLARRTIRDMAEKALRGELASCRIALPDHFDMEIVFTNPGHARRAAWYPSARLAGPRTVRFSTGSYFEILRAIQFLLAR
ncbi:MAG: M55 family metallopeptidase [Parvibaculaceae bacterium]